MKIQTVSLCAASLALLLSGCVIDPNTGNQKVANTVKYGAGAAVTCGIVGALTHGAKGARNSALACGAIGAGVGGYMDYQEKLLRDKLAGTQVDVARQGDQITLTMPDNITFATNSAQLNSTVVATLNDVANVLATYNETTITVAGHTDSTGNDAINNPLSERRAAAVSSHLISRGVAANRIRSVGYGSKSPIADNSTVEGKAKNRRVEILINPQPQS